MELQSIEKIDLSSLTDSEQAGVLHALFDNYWNNYFVEGEKRDYDKMRRIAQICEKRISGYFKQTSLEEISQKKEGLEAIIDVVCFVYPSEYMYGEAVEILNIIAETECMDEINRVRALYNLFSITYENYIRNDVERYIEIMCNLTEDRGYDYYEPYHFSDWKEKIRKRGVFSHILDEVERRRGSFN